MTVRASLPIINEKGLHARASGKFVAVVEQYDADAQVSHNGMTVSGDSLMGLLTLAAGRGSAIELEVTGPDAARLAEALDRLVADKFGESA
ncbi:MAG: HPr family phosphocarrier protein [Paracoccus sp. (in: a-proteobacteria)]|nr:HPr family phosphocarrier protein [Paracoccus sp. (in: a-proteobacteria)]